jgi:hypothetical protein
MLQKAAAQSSRVSCDDLFPCCTSLVSSATPPMSTSCVAICHMIHMVVADSRNIGMLAQLAAVYHLSSNVCSTVLQIHIPRDALSRVH